MHMLPLAAHTAFFAVCLSSSFVRAADTDVTNAAPAGAEPSTNLPPILVEASREGVSARAMPTHVQIIRRERIARAGCTSVKEALEKCAGLFVRTMNGNPVMAQVSARGFGENSFGRVLVLVNGIRLNNPDMSAPNLTRIPVGSVTRVEIVHGPQTVLHGDFAEAGVINIITDETAQDPETTLSATVGAYDSYAAHVGTVGALREEGISWHANADLDKSGGYRDNGDYEIWNADATVRKAWGEERYLEIGADYSHSDYGLPGSLTREQMNHDRRRTVHPDDRAKQESRGVRMNGETPAGDEGMLRLQAFANAREADSKWKGAEWTSLYDSRIYSFGVLPRYTLESVVAQHENRLTAGVDLYHDTTTFDSDYLYSSPFYSSYLDWDYDRTSAAGFLRDEFFFTEEVSLSAGGRGAWSENRIKNRSIDETGHSAETAYEAALLIRPTDTVKAYLRGSRFYHLPLIDEVFAGSGQPNFSLDPESGYSLDVGGDVELAREWTAGLSLYTMWMEDEIYYDPYTYRNLNSPADTRREGLEVHAGWSRKNVASADVMYHYVIAEYTDGAYNDCDIPLVPRHTLTLNGEISVTEDLAFLSTARAVSDQILGSDFKNQGNKLRAYGLLDLAVRYEPSWKITKGFKILFGVDNVFDREYCDYAGYTAASNYAPASSYYYPATGRFWKVCLSYSF